MRWIDRLGVRPQAKEGAVPQPAWRWVADLGAGAIELTINSHQLDAEARAVSLLVQEKDELHLQWRSAGRRHQVRGGVATAPLPSRSELRRIKMAVTDDHGQDLLFPLGPPPAEHRDYEALIELIEDNAMALAGICARPRANLRVTERAEVLRRARRMTLRTAPYLARHAEDWEGHSLRMPFPRRLLTAIPEDEWSTYENRLVRTVVRDGHGELVKRRRDLEETLRQLRKALHIQEDQLGDLRTGDWPRTRRIYELFQGNGMIDGLRAQIEPLEAQLKRLRSAANVLASAQRSPLFRALGAVPDERELRPTNLLLHDSAYHSALVVRQRLNRLLQARAERPIEDPLPHYFRWVEMALRHALAQANFVEIELGTWSGHGWRVEVARPASAWSLELSFRPEGAFDPPTEGTLTILPVWLDLSAEPERDRIMEEIEASAGARRYLVVFPGDGTSTTERPAREHHFPNLVVACSPGRFESVEVLARELVRETWLRDLLAKRWPKWCLACPNPRPTIAGGNKFVCDTCHTEAAFRQEECATCEQRHGVPYVAREVAAGGDISRADVLAEGPSPCSCANEAPRRDRPPPIARSPVQGRKRRRSRS